MDENKTNVDGDAECTSTQEILQVNLDLKRKIDDLKMLLKIIPVGIAISYDPQCLVINGNPAFAQMLGQPVDANLSKSAPAGERPENFRVMRDGRELEPEELPMQIVAAQGVPVLKAKMDLVHHDGRVVHVYGNAAPLFDEKGKSKGAVGAFWDIAELKKSQEELQKSRNQLEILAAKRFRELSRINEELKVRIAERQRAEKALQIRTHDLNERIKELKCLYSINNFFGKQTSEEKIFNEIVHVIPSAWQYPEITYARILADNKEYRTENFKETSWKQSGQIIIHGEKVGTVEVGYLEEKPVLDEGPFLKEERDLLNAIARELTEMLERKHVEEAAKAEQALRDAIEECTAIGIVTIDSLGRLTYVNPAFCKMVERSKEELLGARPPYVFWPTEEPETFNKIFQASIRRERLPGRLEVRFQRKNGDYFDALLLFSYLRDSQGTGIGWVISIGDITEQKKMNATLKESKRQLKHLASQLLMAQEAERKRIAGELHDSIGSSLHAIRFRVEHFLEQIRKDGGDKWAQPLEAIISTLRVTGEEVRRIQTDLRPPILDDMGILAAMDWVCNRFQATYSHIRIKKEMGIEEHEISASLKTVIYRIL
ncbi:MAG: PAS domain S-box protein, partial [Thermodesulfobacteriota bacterium]